MIIAELHTSDLTDTCPQRVYLRRNGRIFGECATALYKGWLFHDGAEYLYRNNDFGGGCEIRAIQHAAKCAEQKAQAENRPFTDAVVAAKSNLQAEVAETLKVYAQRFAPGDDKIIGVELPIRVDLDGFSYASHIDVLIDRRGQLIVRDFKYRDEAPTRAYLARNLQLALYWLAVRHGDVCVSPEFDLWERFGVFPSVEWLHAPNLAPYSRGGSAGERTWKKGDPRPDAVIVYEADFDEAEEQAARDAIKARADMMSAGYFPAIPEPAKCFVCEGRFACPSFERKEK